MKNQLLKHSESGRTMLEMLGVLGIMGIIMYGAIAGINYGMGTYKINQTYNEVQEAVQAIQDLYSWSRCYPGNDFTPVVEDNDIFASATPTLGDSRTVEGDWGNCDTSPGAINTHHTFILTYTNVDEDSCNRLNEMDWGTVVMDSNCANGTIKFCPRANACQTVCDDNNTTGYRC